MLLLATVAMAGHVTGERDPLEVRMYTKANTGRNETTQAMLRQLPAWQNFLGHHGTWYVQFDERSAMPHRAMGRPIATMGNTPAQRAMQFVQGQLGGFGSQRADLYVRNSNTTDQFSYVHLGQNIDGREVLFGGAYIKMDLLGRVVSFGLDIHKQGEGTFSLSQEQTKSSAVAALPLSSNSIEFLGEAWLPVPRPGQYELRPVHRFAQKGTRPDGIPFNYLTVVDAATGAILMRNDQVRYCDGHDHTDEPQPLPLPGGPSIQVNATIYPGTYMNGTGEVGLPNLKVTQGTTFYTDANGFATANAANATVSLEGLWSRVVTTSVTPSATTTVPNGPHVFSFDNDANIRERTAYYHVNIVHDHMKTFYPSFTLMDNALPTNIDLTTDNCNAFYDGSSINFYASANNCQSFALFNDVIYHEYGHGINDKYYQSQGGFFANGAMGEGYADIWALGITQEPVMSLGYLLNDPNSFIRRYDEDLKVYPEDLVGEVHADGEIIAGAWWDLHLNFGSMQQMLDMYAESFNALITGPDGDEGQIYVDILIEALTIDDSPANGGDNDITNGTPNDLDIINAFDAHGITLLSNATLVHTPITVSDADAAIDLTAQITLQYPWALDGAIMRYRLNVATTWQTVTMTNSGSTYSASIPAQPGATIIGYYMALQNVNGVLAAVDPIGAHNPDPNLPHFILVGYQLDHTEDFDDSQTNGWQEGIAGDNNTTGTWTIDVPMGSYSADGDMVQPDYQNTPGGIACAVTGNATNTSAGVGENDVDAGHTSLVTPPFDLSGYVNPAITYARYYTNSPPSGANPGADWWQVFISDNGSDWVRVENTMTSDMHFRVNAIRVTDYVSLTNQVRIKFIASDSTRVGQYLDGGSLVEGAVDDLKIYELKPDAVSEETVADLSLAPVPATSILTIYGNATRTLRSYVVTDALGRAVLQGNLNRATGPFRADIPVATLRPGVYLISIEADGGRSVRRFIKAND